MVNPELTRKARTSMRLVTKKAEVERNCSVGVAVASFHKINVNSVGRTTVEGL